MTVNGKRPRSYRTTGDKLHVELAAALPAGAALTVDVRYSGNPRPIRSVWGDVGFEELTNGALVAGQPNGAASWFPCDDHPSSKASYRIVVSTDNPYRVVANGELLGTRTRAAMTTWTFEQAEPTSTYLITLQIGMYDAVRLAKTPVPMNAALPGRLTRVFEHDFGRQPQMMKLFDSATLGESMMAWTAFANLYDTQRGWGDNAKRVVDLYISFQRSNCSAEVKEEARSAAISYEIDKLPGFPHAGAAAPPVDDDRSGKRRR